MLETESYRDYIINERYDSLLSLLPNRQDGEDLSNKIAVDLDGCFNYKFHQYLESTNWLQIFFGGSSSGKSVFLAQRAVYDVLNGGRNYLIIRNISNTIRDSVYNEIKKVITAWDVRAHFTIRVTDMLITCQNGYQIIFKGLDDVEKLKSITPEKGVVTDVWIEEATETKDTDIKQLLKRLRGGDESIPKRITMSFNPIMKTHWIYKTYFNEYIEGEVLNTEDLLIVHSTYKDNRFLTEQDIKLLENEQDEYFYNVYTLGKWGVLGNIIFKNWTVKDIKSDPIYRTFDYFRHGLDFGYCVDEDTEILTQDGWKNHDILTKNDVVLTLNAENGLSEWQRIESIHKFLGKFDMRLIEQKSHSSFITFNHRWLVENHNTRKFKITVALGGADTVPCSRKCLNVPKHEVYSDHFVELVGWYWTEGQITTGGISLWQNDGENAESIKAALIKEFGPELIKTRNGRNRAKAGWVERPQRNKLRHFAINLNGAKRLLNVAPNKQISSSFICSLTQKQLELLIDISVKADGSTNKYGTRIITQNNLNRLNPMQMAASLIGIRTTLTSYINRGSKHWRLTLFKSNDKAYLGESKQKRIIYHGLVWCPTTENGTWLARRNGTVYFTGNSNDPTAYNRMYYHKATKTLYIIDEIHKLGITNDLIAQEIKPYCGNETVICDSAEPKSIEELKKYGINAKGALKGRDSVNFGIQWIQQQTVVIDVSCQETKNNFEQYHWLKNKDGEVLNVPADKDNDHIDDIRYAMEDLALPHFFDNVEFSEYPEEMVGNEKK